MVKILVGDKASRKVKRLYPWVFADEIIRVEGEGYEAEVYDKNGFVAFGTYSPNSRIRFRFLGFERERIDEEFFEKRFIRALNIREGINSNAYRLVFSESDFLGGLIVDRYKNGFVIQIRSKPMEVFKNFVVEGLKKSFSPEFVYERSDMTSRKDEGLKPFKGLLYGRIPESLIIEENGFNFLVDIVGGLKTGFYLDQRDNREYLFESLRGGEKVLDLFCYTGAFSVYLSKKAKEIVAVDINDNALEIAKENLKLNGCKNVNLINLDAFEFLKTEKELYDLIIADPPAISKKKSEKGSIKWAIWKLAVLSLKRLKDYGRLFICSCTYQMDVKDMLRQIRLASFDTGIPIAILSIRTQPKDHPYIPHFPESLYLKCLDVLKLPKP